MNSTTLPEPQVETGGPLPAALGRHRTTRASYWLWLICGEVVACAFNPDVEGAREKARADLIAFVKAKLRADTVEPPTTNPATLFGEGTTLPRIIQGASLPRVIE